jgi:hypothetical protein
MGSFVKRFHARTVEFWIFGWVAIIWRSSLGPSRAGGLTLMNLNWGGLNEKQRAAIWNLGTISEFACRQWKTKYTCVERWPVAVHQVVTSGGERPSSKLLTKLWVTFFFLSRSDLVRTVTASNVSPADNHKEYYRVQSVPHRKHYISATKPNRLMLHRETVAVYYENHVEHTNRLCGQNLKFSMLKQVVYIVTADILRVNWIKHF